MVCPCRFWASGLLSRELAVHWGHLWKGTCISTLNEFFGGPLIFSVTRGHLWTACSEEGARKNKVD